MFTSMSLFITDSPSTEEILPYLVSEVAPPVITAILITIIFSGLNMLRPVSRWRHAAKRDSAILSALPKGKERQVWEKIVEDQAATIRSYQHAEKRWLRIIIEVLATGALSIGAIFFFGLADSWGELLEGFLASLQIYVPLAVIGLILWIVSAIAGAHAKKKARAQTSGVAYGRVGNTKEPLHE